MSFDSRNRSQFPDRGPAVTRYRGLSRWIDFKSGIQATLDRLAAAQTRQGKASIRTRKKPIKPKAKKSGRGFRTLVVIAAVLYGITHLPVQLDDILDSLGDIEHLLSGNGDELADKLIEKVLPPFVKKSISPGPDQQRQPVRQTAPKPAPPRTMPMTGPVTRVSELPHYPGAETVFENDSVGLYATTHPVGQVADTTLRLLADAGWNGRVAAQNEKMRHMTFTRGTQELTAYISFAPGLDNRTSIEYHVADDPLHH